MGEESSSRVVNERVYVAVGNDFEESKSTLLWALHNFDGHFRILHVHQPRLDPIPDRTRTTVSGTSHHDQERESVHKVMDAYINVCNQAEVYAEKRFVEMRDIGKGIVELIELHAVTKLVMGAAADIHYSEGMTELKSTKAMFVNLHAHPSCQIWFTCGGQLIHTREGDLNMVDLDVMPSSVHPGSNSTSYPSSTGSSEVDDNLVMVSYERGETSRFLSASDATPLPDDAHRFLSSNTDTLETIRNGEIYEKFEIAMVESENARRMAFQGLMMRLQESEKDALEAIHRARVFENLYKEELRLRMELEEILAKEKRESQSSNRKKEEELKSQITASKRIVIELNERIVASERMLEICQKERDALRVERDNAIGTAEHLLRSRAGEASSSHRDSFWTEFSFLEIQRATDNFEPSSKIGEDGYWSIYKGFLRHTQVTVKMLQSESPRTPLQFHHELDTMGKLRHPNLVTLIGVCPEACALVYEYLPGESLEEWLTFHDDASPLSYQARVRIAKEICSALVFLHSSKPRNFIHGDLRIRDIQLDANFTAKLCGFRKGPSRRINVEPADCPHVDPHLLTTGELSSKSDVYSFGVVLLQLLTGRDACNLAREMRVAVDAGNTSYLTALLDPLAGEWPERLAVDLAELALRCCDREPYNRPDLGSEVWSTLETMRATHGEVPSFPQARSNDDDDQLPGSFFCPIYHEIMEEPTVAADGHTYEAQAVREWLSSGHNTSPMTNLVLSHLNLVPNLTLRSMIQEWRERHPELANS